ncbi:Uncharacterised protein [Candidatus Bilamarchaeum dharawalense]|uniref:Uncharacterized protein n=1 Tax=Candidatus Bilamarchaeum dharawalense TaxID=2885759 RepID=A0A5E4LM48_9ARCH|nr:Uncharacterised protein [Candidatus Bilamarchaeum dharawalense]
MGSPDEVGSKLVELEIETQSKVSHSLSLIEVALADWEAAKKKPKNLEGQINYLRNSYKLLSEWEKNSLKGKKDLNSTLNRLRKFTLICQKLQSAKNAS